VYSTLITYPVYDLNSSEFVGVIQDVLQKEFINQTDNHSIDYLPVVVNTDEHLTSPIADSVMNPAYVSVIKGASKDSEHFFFEQNSDLNYFVIGVNAYGLANLRKIQDAIYIILNDMDVKHYLWQLKNDDGENYISDSGMYKVIKNDSQFEEKKTINDKDVVYGSLILQVQIAEVVKQNTYPDLEGMNTDLNLGENKTSVKFETNY
jgi:hypothetical protein